MSTTTKMHIQPTLTAEGPGTTMYYVPTTDASTKAALTGREFWTLATKVPDYMDKNPDITFTFDPNEWSDIHYNRLAPMIIGKKNLEVI